MLAPPSAPPEVMPDNLKPIFSITVADGSHHWIYCDNVAATALYDMTTKLSELEAEMASLKGLVS